jgi:hypothetical protein
MARGPGKTVEQKLDEWGAKGDLETLVEAGCDRAEILSLLRVLDSQFVDDSWKRLTGLKQKQLRSAVLKFRYCADRIEGLNSRPLMWAAIVYGPSGNPDFYKMPGLLRLYADILEFEIENSRPRKNPLQNTCKALLVDMALRCGKPYDKEVAGLIGAALGREYDTKNHSEWRANHHALLDQVKLSRSRPKIPPPPSSAGQN